MQKKTHCLQLSHALLFQFSHTLVLHQKSYSQKTTHPKLEDKK